MPSSIPSMIVLENFLRKHGPDALVVLEQLLNDSQHTHTAIARSFTVDRGKLTHFIHMMFDRRYLLKPDVIDYLNEREQIRRLHYERMHRTQAHLLRLIPSAHKDPPAAG